MLLNQIQKTFSSLKATFSADREASCNTEQLKEQAVLEFEGFCLGISMVFILA